ncbi:MAG TPA: AI-2E family transporter [Balneolaceae bacterium]|nr:AI-2E family transporter [Balneolaceae bacterium]
MSIHNEWYVKYTYYIAALCITVFAMIMAKSVIVPLLFSLFFSILLAPISSWLERYNIPRMLSSLAALLVGILVLFGIGFFFYSQMTDFAADAEMFTDRLEELLNSLEGFLSAWFSIEGEINLDRIVTELAAFIQDNMTSLTRGLSGAASAITTFFLVPIFMYLILLLRGMLKTFLLMAFGGDNGKERERVEVIISKIKILVQRYIAGLLMVITILAILYSTLLTVIGIDHAIFFGSFAAMLNVIPFIGPFLGSILPILYALITMDSLIYPLIIIAGFYVVQMLEGNLFTPVIVGSQVSMNALATLILIFVGAQIWGLSGMILFIPLGAILKIIFDEVDSLKHYGYILGRSEEEKTRKKGKFAKKVSSMTRKKSEKKNSEPETE